MFFKTKVYLGTWNIFNLFLKTKFIFSVLILIILYVFIIIF